MSHDHPGQDDPGRGRDEFDHFFSDRRAAASGQDPDATAWSGAAGPQYDEGRTQAVDHTSYARPAQPPQYDNYAPAQPPHYDEYAPANQGYYPPDDHFTDARPRRGAIWAPILVIVASLAIVAVVVAIVLNGSSGPLKEGAFTPSATGTKTTQDTSPTGSGSSSSSSSPSSSDSSSSSPSSYATALPGGATSCSGSYGTGPRTSCAFAGVVATLYNAKKDASGNASFTAKSPETHKDYSVSCSADSYVTCTTATGAVVYILRG